MKDKMHKIVGQTPRKGQMPGWYDQNHKFHVHTRIRKLIVEHDGRIMKMRDLPKTAQLALIQYIAVDGEAWDYPESSSSWQKMRTWYVEKYGQEKFGFIAKLPIQDLIESVIQDRDIDEYGSWQQYHSRYMAEALKHTAPSKSPWPVILASFGDETLQDGWTRFHNYCERGMKACPALFFPMERNNE